MKRVIITFMIIIILVVPLQTNAASNYYQPPEKSDEELIMDMFFSLLLPHIKKPVMNYYSQYLSETPLVYPYQIKILNMKRTNQYRGFIFSLEIEITPVVGPHIEVGKDHLTFTITPSNVTLDKFEHIETYELPPNWQHIKRKQQPL
ncbi:DUF3888 domain-containing protein [Chungangia koreensis]|uniref:DUF3888 domain-containing protein n=1 Tax=Chungangia koreensis TaxID=752657 RepID=A0ABV8WYX3_9LACT